jgi:hypothetical protein
MEYDYTCLNHNSLMSPKKSGHQKHDYKHDYKGFTVNKTTWIL